MRRLSHGLALLALLGTPAAGQEAAGEALYALGARPGAAAPRALTAGGAVLPATALPCASCHGQDGLGGRAEAGLRPPPIAWSALAQPRPERPAYDAPALLRAVAQGIAPGGRALDPAMPRYALTLEDAAALTAWLRALDDRPEPGVTGDGVRIGLLLPPGARGEGFAGALRAALSTAAPAGVFGRRIELRQEVAADAEEAAAAARRLLATGVLAVVSALPGADAAAAAGVATAARAPVLGLRAPEEASPLAWALLPGVTEEGVALLRLLPDPARAVILVPDEAAWPLAERMAERVAALSGAEPRLLRAEEAAAAADASAVLLLAPAARLAVAARPLAPLPVPVLVPGSLGGPAAAAAADVLGRPVLVALGAPPEAGEGTAFARFRASEAARGGLAGRLGHAAGEVLVEALRRAGRGLTRERLATSLSAAPFQVGSMPTLRLAGGPRGGGGGVWLVQVDAEGRVRPAAVVGGEE